MNTAEITSAYQQRIHQVMLDILDVSENQACPLLEEAIEYSLLNGGKRLRPLLCYATGIAFNADEKILDIAAASLEMIHSYSLIHDDLPAMDDADLRRKKPSLHQAFDEATAILAGDALQALAFDNLTSLLQHNFNADFSLLMIKVLAEAAGRAGMCAGQCIDLEAEFADISLEDLETMHLLKTGALIRASVRMGALSAQIDDPHILQKLDEFAESLGLAFQIQDDILDATQTTEELGKPANQDASTGKSTYVTILGLESAKHRATELLDEAQAVLTELDLQDSYLSALTAVMSQRVY